MKDGIMIRDQGNHISFVRWAELMAREIYFYEDEKPKSLVRLYEMFGDEFDEEESPPSKPKGNNTF